MKTILFSGGFQMVKNYGGYSGVDIWIGEKLTEENKNADYFIGHSVGANFAVLNVANLHSKYIFVNPLIKKRTIFLLAWRWLRFLVFEGIKKEKIVPLKYWFYAFNKVLELVKVDFMAAIQKIPRDNLVIIRGKRDNFFCDEESIKIAKEKNTKVIEVDAGHDWNENIAKEVREVISI